MAEFVSATLICFAVLALLVILLCAVKSVDWANEVGDE